MALIKVKDSQGNWTVSPVISKQNVYSTDEIQVGTWIDGKPIYRKVLYGTLAQTTDGTLTSSYIAVENLHIKTVTSMSALVGRDAGNYQVIPLLDRKSGNTYFIKYFFNRTDQVIQLQNGISDFSNMNVIVILEYTKTTD